MHQIVQGNLDRAAATFDAVATGQVAPPELDIAVTPRRSRAVTHRLVMLVPGAPADPASVATARGVLAAVAPGLDAVATALLPGADRIVATVEWQGTRRPVSLADLGVVGLDAVHLVGADGDTSSLVHRTRIAGAAMLGAIGDLHAVAVDLADTAGAFDGASMEEFAVLAAALRGLLAATRPLAAADLSVDVIAGPETADPDGDVAAAVVARLGVAHDELSAAMAIEPAGAASLGASLAELARLQVRVALPPLTADEQSWRRVATAALGEAAQRLARLAGAEDASGHRRIELALGTRLPLPHPVPVPSATIAAGAGPAVAAQPDAAVPGWLQRLRRTRPQVARFDDVLAAVEVLGTAGPAFEVVQLPADAGGQWVAEVVPAQSTLHLVLTSTGFQPVLAPEVTGIIVDDWVEPIPLADSHSGLAFHFDTPGAEAPQAVLLAVAPEGAAAWSVSSVAATLRSTLGLARLRAVGPAELAAAAVDDITALGHYLPATNLPEPVRFPVGAGGAS